MICPKCKGKLACKNTDPRKDGLSVHRRYECPGCSGLFSTTEVFDESLKALKPSSINPVPASTKPVPSMSDSLPYDYEDEDFFDDDDPTDFDDEDLDDEEGDEDEDSTADWEREW